MRQQQWRGWHRKGCWQRRFWAKQIFQQIVLQRPGELFNWHRRRGGGRRADDGAWTAKRKIEAMEVHECTQFEAKQRFCCICLGIRSWRTGQYDCEHRFCCRCSKSWAKVKKSCPLCQKPVKKIGQKTALRFPCQPSGRRKSQLRMMRGEHRWWPRICHRWFHGHCEIFSVCRALALFSDCVPVGQYWSYRFIGPFPPWNFWTHLKSFSQIYKYQLFSKSLKLYDLNVFGLL